MTKNEREIFQRNIMVAIKLLTKAYELDDPIGNLNLAGEAIKNAFDIVKHEAV